MPPRAALLVLCIFAAPAAVAQSNSFTLTTLANFSGANGAVPTSNLIQASDGNFYGTTLHGGAYGFGSLYQLTPAGVITTLHSFAGPDGRYPYGSLIQGADGFLYGTTTEGGALEMGTIFRLSSNATLTTLHSFNGLDGNSPYANLVLATDGNFYGTTAGGGSDGMGFGTLFRMTPTGIVTSIHSFTDSYDGMLPYNNLLQASNGYLYGATSTGGGAHRNGVVFQSSLDGNVTGVGLTETQTLWPYTGLNEDSQENLYGTTSTGGATGHGEIFSLGSDAVITDVFDFPLSGDGGIPFAGLILASDGNQYGTTSGYFTDGGAFSLTPSAQMQSLAFTSATGDVPFSSLMQAADGNFYGTTSTGGSSGQGTVFRLTASPPLPAPVQLSFDQSSIAAGATATLSWQAINAFSATMQQCYAFITGNPAAAGTWSGLQPGKLEGDSYTGTAAIAPTEPGHYTYALTCGGTESGSASLTVTGTAQLPSLTTLTTAAPTLTQGDSVTLTASISNLNTTGGALIPTGTVTFRYGQQTIAKASINTAGIATVTGSSAGVPAGNYILSASYSGDTTYAPSNSAVVPINLRAQSATVLSVTPSPISAGADATLLATVSEKTGPQLPTGRVTFSYKGRVLGQSNLLAGQATFTQATQGLAPGSYPVSANYAGDASNAPSSVTLVITVTP